MPIGKRKKKSAAASNAGPAKAKQGGEAQASGHAAGAPRHVSRLLSQAAARRPVLRLSLPRFRAARYARGRWPGEKRQVQIRTEHRPLAYLASAADRGR